MNWLKSSFWNKVLALTLVFVVTSLLVFSFHQEVKANPIQDIIERFFPDERPPTQPATGIAKGGAGRGPICEITGGESGLLTLMPAIPDRTDENNLDKLQEIDAASEVVSTNQYVGSYTIEEHPTFWFYLPYSLPAEDSQGATTTSSNRVAQFVLLDETNRVVSNELISVKLLKTPHLVKYALPYSLETGEVYNWYFSVICDSDKLSRNPVVRGWLQRIEPTPKLQLALKEVSHFEQYQTYFNNGIWLDAINSLVDIRQQFPYIHQDAWTSLLAYFEIPEANQPDILKSATPSEREVVKGNQLPAKI